MKRERRRARSLALQALYEIDCVGHAPDQVLQRILEQTDTLSQEAVEFLERVVRGTLSATEELDRLVAECAAEWPVDRTGGHRPQHPAPGRVEFVVRRDPGEGGHQ
jgi:N utilization substance protein B